jgi:fumarate hydratase subunit beta
MSRIHLLTTPLTDDDVAGLLAGDRVLLSGVVYTARDAAHRRMIEALDSGGPLPIPIQGQAIYYVGPSPTPPGRVTGSAGPTTSCRMDPYTPRLLELGLKATIGKGSRSAEVVEAMRRHRAVYLAAIGGAAALIASRITKCEIVAYPELGPEAVRRLVVEDFPAIVANDIHGGDVYVR